MTHSVAGVLGGPHRLVHEPADPHLACLILDVTGLECRVLKRVGEDQESAVLGHLRLPGEAAVETKGSGAHCGSRAGAESFHRSAARRYPHALHSVSRLPASASATTTSTAPPPQGHWANAVISPHLAQRRARYHLPRPSGSGSSAGSATRWRTT